MAGVKERFVVHRHCLSCPATHSDCQRAELIFKDGEKDIEVLPFFYCAEGIWWLGSRISREGLLSVQENPPPKGQDLDYRPKREKSVR